MAIQATNKNLSLLFTLLMGPISITLLVISVYLIQPKVEAKLTSNVKSVLKEHNIEAEVSFSGRDGILEGEVDSQEMVANAQKISLSVFGTRVIRNYLRVQIKKNNPILTHNIKKISYIAMQSEKGINKTVALTLKGKEKSIFISQVDKIIANMPQQKSPIISNLNLANNKPNAIKLTKFPNTFVEIEDKTVQKEDVNSKVFLSPSHTITGASLSKKNKISTNKSNEVSDIINNFNSLLGSTTNNILIPSHHAQHIAAPLIQEIDLSTLRFSNNSILLSKEAHQVLNKISKSIKGQSYSYIELTAYAEDSDIGYARGVAIRDYLATKGIQKNIIHVEGQTQLKNSNKTVSFEVIEM